MYPAILDWYTTRTPCIISGGAITAVLKVFMCPFFFAPSFSLILKFPFGIQNGLVRVLDAFFCVRALYFLPSLKEQWPPFAATLE